VTRIPAALALVLFAFVAAPPRALAQDPARVPPETLKVFIDCMEARCDLEYIRTEVNVVDHVRDREVADVHVLVTSEGTSGGGEYTLHFIGRRAFQGIESRLTQSWRQTDTTDTIRSALVRTIKLGLVPYLARTPMRDRIEVAFTGERAREAAGRGGPDPWNHWIFRASGNTRVDGESHAGSAAYSASLSASHVTDAWKLSLSTSGSYRESRYDISDEDRYRSISRSYGVSGLAVKSITGHWSAGVRAAASSSTYLNQRLAVRFAPAIEYDVLPYAESTRRKLTIQYAVGADYFRYDRETIFGRSSERRLDNALVAALDMRRPWGSMSTGIEAGSYLDDWSKKRLEISGDANVRILKGLSLSVYGSTAVVRDQIYLPKGEATPEEILVRQRQLATSYRYVLSIGFTYTFGSIYTSVVNPRLSGSFGQPW
jgi:hypothetical protein